MGVIPCAPQQPVFGIVTFDPAVFKTVFPAFDTVADAALQGNFARAELQLRNSCGSRVKNANQRDLLLNLLTAHITALMNGVNGQQPGGLVGRVSDATEGSVSVGSEYSSTVGQSQAYYIQTPWGAEFWQATARYRTMVYVAQCPPNTGPPWPNFGANGWGGWDN